MNFFRKVKNLRPSVFNGQDQAGRNPKQKEIKTDAY